MTSEFLMLPHFDPTIFTFGDSNIGLRWYGLMYLLGFIFARWLAVRRANQPNSGWTVDLVDTLLFNGFMGVFLGGRIGDVFFYNFDHFVQDPLYLFRVWEGGMSFHGGLIGVIISMIWTSYSQKRSFWQTADFVAPLIPFGLGMGRIGNFINLELWGRETEVPWAMIFPNDPLLLPRHPSQLYEAFLEGFVLFIILNVFIKKPRPHELPQAIAENAQRVSLTNQELTANQALKTRTFAFLWFMFFINITTGIGLVSAASPMAQNMTTMTASAAAVMVGIIGLFNGFGRLAWATLSDFIGRPLTYSWIFVLDFLLLFFLLFF